MSTTASSATERAAEPTSVPSPRPSRLGFASRPWCSALVLLLVGVGAAWYLGASDYYGRILASIGLSIIVVIGLNILCGLTGQISLGHAGFYAVGAYLAALLSVKAGLPILVAMAIGVLAAAVLGLVLAVPALKVSGPYLAMVTLAFGLIVHSILVNFPALTNGAAGVFPVPAISIGGMKLSIEQMNYLIVVLAAIGMYSLGCLLESRWGRALRAISGNPLAAASSGVPVLTGKRFAFIFSAMLAGMAGSIYATVNAFVNPDPFHFDLSILFLIMLMVGGSGTLWGPVVGVVIMTLVERSLSGVSELRIAIYAITLLLILRFMPQGVTGLVRMLARRRSRRGAGAADAAEPVDVGAPAELPARAAAERPDGAAAPLALQAEGVTRRFGDLEAVDSVDLSVVEGSIHALVGPNGAGKTTMFNLISGVDVPTSGRVRLFGEDTTGMAAHRIAKLGLARTFQNLALFDELTALENVTIGSHLRSRQTFFDSLLGTPRTVREERELRERSRLLLDFVGLGHAEDELAADLPQGHRRHLELARALASDPRILLLDEPAAGLNPTEVEHLGQLIRRIREHGTTVVLVEHHMKLVMTVSDRVTVMDRGRVIADGRPAEVRSDERVIAAYLGSAAGRGRERAGEPADPAAAEVTPTAPSAGGQSPKEDLA